MTIQQFKVNLSKIISEEWREEFQTSASTGLSQIQQILGGVQNSLQKFIDSTLFCTPSKIYPEKSKIFRALKVCPPQDLKVVILGMDPYHTKGVADGLCFSTPSDLLYTPPSLKNIFRELELEYDTLLLDPSTDLERWGRQGVLLLNTALTVYQGVPGSHASIWKNFTEYLLTVISKAKSQRRLIFLLWGNHAKSYKPFINTHRDFILEAVHPSPLSANRSPSGWFHNQHFLTTNELIFKHNGNMETINWIEWDKVKSNPSPSKLME